MRLSRRVEALMHWRERALGQLSESAKCGGGHALSRTKLTPPPLARSSCETGQREPLRPRQTKVACLSHEYGSALLITNS
jgi:hypothetical protein